ncbi:hypothetical protein NKH10_32545, partial [Mesorhizobium sp. M1340]|uniref:hypothetical protein n=1 Tax=Mesorhizobium sp. M1340 TaxID=2957087 RepID=UPI00333C6002
MAAGNSAKAGGHWLSREAGSRSRLSLFQRIRRRHIRPIGAPGQGIAFQNGHICRVAPRKSWAELAAQGGETDNLMIDATHLKAHRTA